MTTHIEGSFTVTSWDEETYVDLEGESKLTKVTFVQDYSGGIDATASWAGQMFYADDGTAFYTGLQRFDGTLDGHKGTFVLEARGGYDGSEALSEWTVVAGSGTAELAGLKGAGSATAGAGTEGTFVFDYDLR